MRSFLLTLVVLFCAAPANAKLTARLLKVVERDNTLSGFDWKADYDPFGRRIRTTETAVTNGALLSQQFLLEQRYDPEVEFLEVGVIENGILTWKLYGPDLNGVYGGLNGVGGFDAIIPRGELFCPVVGDSLGNLHGIYDQGHGKFDWFGSRVTAYGAVPGYKPVAMGHGYTVGHNSAWRGKYGDVHGSVAVGVRNLLWDSDIFLSGDPLGHAGNNTPHTAFNGIPTVYWDADGRVAKAVGNAISGAARDAWNHSVFGNAPPPREVVVHRDPTQGFWNRIFAGQRYVDQDGNRVEQSRDIVRVDSRGMGIDYAGGEPGGGMIKGGAKIGVSLWSRITSLFRSGADDAAKTSSEILLNSTSQLQSKFKHAADFGVTGTPTTANLSRFSGALNQHINSPGVQAIHGTYRGSPVVHYVNPSTGLNVMRDAAGNFISGWKLNPAQLQNVLTRGSL